MPYMLIWLLLPLAAASGWWLASRQQSEKSRPKILVPHDYYKGINYFLNEQPDKAIEVFIRMLEVDSETVEPHLALGNLFRRRGEVDRAIRIHQNLIARPMLSKEQREQALLELGHDYLQAGLFDRAENLLEELVKHDNKNLPALRLLQTIYEQEQDWLNTIKIARNIETQTAQKMGPTVAQYYCEIATIHIQSGEFSEARKMLRRSLAQNSACGRAMILQVELDNRSKNYRTVIKTCKRVLALKPEYLVDVIEIMFAAYEHLGKRQDLMLFTESVINDQTAIHSVLFYFDYLRTKKDTRIALAFLENYLQKHPSLQGLERLLLIQQSAESDIADSQPAQSQLQVSLQIIAQLLENSPLYNCRHCGFSGMKRHWKCPGCHQWETITAVTGFVPGKEHHAITGKILNDR